MFHAYIGQVDLLREVRAPLGEFREPGVFTKIIMY